MRSLRILGVVLALLSVTSCGNRLRGKYRCSFNCGCRDRNIIHELEFISSRKVIVSDGVDSATSGYAVDGNHVTLEMPEHAFEKITIVNDYTLVIFGSGCLSGTYKRIQ